MPNQQYKIRVSAKFPTSKEGRIELEVGDPYNPLDTNDALALTTLLNDVEGDLGSYDPLDTRDEADHIVMIELFPVGEDGRVADEPILYEVDARQLTKEQA